MYGLLYCRQYITSSTVYLLYLHILETNINQFQGVFLHIAQKHVRQVHSIPLLAVSLILTTKHISIA